MAGSTTNIVKRSLEDLGAKAKARELGRVVLGILGRWSSESVRLGGVVRGVMTANIATCSPGDTLHRASQLMWDRDCGAVPVVDPTGRPTGILTDRDLTMAAYTKGLPLVAIPIGDVVSGRVHSVAPGDSVDEVVALMRGQRIRRVMVVDGGHKLVGIVALADVARYVSGLGPTRRDAALLLADLVATLSERRPSSGSTERAAE